MFAGGIGIGVDDILDVWLDCESPGHMDRVRALQGDLFVCHALAFLTLSVLIVAAISSHGKAKSRFVEVTSGKETSIDQPPANIMREAVHLWIGVGDTAIAPLS